MGSGSISRGFRGELKQWQITPGTCDPSPMSSQFSIFISRDGGHKKYASVSVLAPGRHGSLGSSTIHEGIVNLLWLLGLYVTEIPIFSSILSLLPLLLVSTDLVKGR